MANPNDRDDDDDGDVVVHVPRTPKNLASRKSLPSVESALDDFIVRAKQKELDVSEFTPETREQQLRDRVSELEKKLADAEARAAAASTSSSDDRPAGRSWPAVVGAFVLGGACMFAVSALMSSDRQPTREATAAPAIAPAPTDLATPSPPTVTPPTGPTATTTATTTPGAAAMATRPAPITTPAIGTADVAITGTTTTAATGDKAKLVDQADKITKGARPARPPLDAPKTRATGATDQADKPAAPPTAKPTDTPAGPANQGSGDLYNPF